ncbi:MAG: glycosyltransferase family 2 protein, partial [Elusimicrobiota bacterium]|nr:glycosyltransferase family 2 protein [Elusimicrobiota bacterium]
LAAEKRFAAGRRATPLHHLLLPWEFFARAVLKGGFLDGGPGLTWAGLAAFHSWLKYAKLARMQEAAK